MSLLTPSELNPVLKNEHPAKAPRHRRWPKEIQAEPEGAFVQISSDGINVLILGTNARWDVFKTYRLDLLSNPTKFYPPIIY